MIELSNEPKRLLSTFLNYRNTIDIYTEDNYKDKEFYNVLFRRLLDGTMKVNDVTPLGSKSNVIERCKTEPENGRKKIFIIDGDVSIIHKKNLPKIKNLYILDAYCIENFLIDKSAVINFLYVNCTTKPIEQIETELDFDNWLEDYASEFIELFLHFALADLFEKKYTLFNAHKYMIRRKNGPPSLNKEKIRVEIDSLKDEILQSKETASFQREYQKLKEKWANCTQTLLTIVSGKDYLIPILLSRSQGFRKSNALPALEEVKFNLVQYCDLTRLENLKDTIENS